MCTGSVFSFHFLEGSIVFWQQIIVLKQGMGLLLRHSEKIYFIIRLGLFWSSVSKRKPSRNIHVLIMGNLDIVCAWINILKENMRSDHVWVFLMMFANMSNYVLDVKSGWIYNLTLSVSLFSLISLFLSHYPHTTLSSDTFIWRMWVSSIKQMCYSPTSWITVLGIEIWNWRGMGPHE